MKGKDEKYKIEIKNKKAQFGYFLETHFEAGIQLTGTEIKSIRSGQVNLKDSFCYFRKGDLFVKNMHISEYKYGNQNNHDPERPRKLLLKRSELKKIEKKVKERGYTIVPTRIYINERGLAKIEIAMARGKKNFDKRESIKRKDIKRDMERAKNIRY